MVNKNMRYFKPILSMIILTLPSCMQLDPYHKSETPVLQISEANDIQVECVYLDREEIISRHGLKENPFLAPSLSFTPRQMLVFEVNIMNNDSPLLVLDNRDVRLYFNNNLYKPLRTIQMEEKIESFSDSSINTYENKIAKKYMLPNVVKIKGNSSRKGYLVFMGQMDAKGKAELMMDFTSEKGLLSGEMTFEYDLVME